MTVIDYIGNFGPARSTENAYAYAFRDWGMAVDCYQQERVSADPTGFFRRIARKVRAGEAHAVLYTRSHNGSALRPTFTGIWRMLEEIGVATATVHLDVFVGVQRHRMSDLWDDPLFTAGKVFTPDPALAARIDSETTEHVWLPPAADIRDSDPPGVARDELAGKVVFVGSRYGTPRLHPEYPFRARLLDWLAARYKDRFVWYGNGSPCGSRRGSELWDVYASPCVIVGDSCFAGDRPYYWSDRIPETQAHGGYLIHPEIVGLSLEHPFVIPFPAGDLDALAHQIDHAMEDGPDRDALRAGTIAHTRTAHTYVQRAERILEEIA